MEASSLPIQVSAAQIRRMMRDHKVTISMVVSKWGVSANRVKQVRKVGGPWDWRVMIRSTRAAA